jgi:hypothetical protein
MFRKKVKKAKKAKKKLQISSSHASLQKTAENGNVPFVTFAHIQYMK